MISFDTLKWNKNLKAFEISLIFLLQSFTVISLTPNSIEVFEQLPFVKCFQSISFHGNNISLFFIFVFYQFAKYFIIFCNCNKKQELE